MESLILDLRYASRNLIRSPGFTAMGVSTLAVGIAVVTATFSLLDAVLLRPLPFSNPDQLVRIYERRQGVPGGSLSAHEVMAWREHNQVFDGLAMFMYASGNLTGSAEPQTARVLAVSADYFSVLGVGPVRGRATAAGDDLSGADRIAVISDRLWNQRFGRSDAAVGSDVMLDNRPHRIVGVMPASTDLDPDLWVPMDVALEVQRVGRHALQVFARTKPGITVQQAERALDDISNRMSRERSDFDPGHTAYVVPLYDDIVGGAQRALLVAAGAVACVLLIACANVAHLLLTRTAARQGDIAIRVALGARRSRLLQYFLIESLLLGAAGGAAGALVATWIVDLLPRVIAVDIPRLTESTMNGRVLIFSLVTALMTGILCGVLPAIRGSRVSLRGGMGDGDRTSPGWAERASSLLTSSEIAMAMMLLIGAALLIQSFVRLSRVDPGFNPENVLTAPISLPGTRYARPEQRTALFEELRTRLAAVPNVESVAGISYLPLTIGDNRMGFAIEGRPALARGDEIRASIRTVAGDYFRTMRIPLRRGRTFDDSDARRSVPLIRYFEQQPLPPGFNEPQPRPVAVVNETLARRFWPDEDPIGKRIRLLYSPWISIVGVVGNVRHASLASQPDAEIYLTHTQEPQSALTLLVRTDGAPRSRAGAVREQIRAIDKELPITTLRPMDDVLSASLGRPRFDALLLAAFSSVALLLALIGIYSVTSYGVGQRTREIGIRTALGASRGDVLHLVLGRAMRVTTAGVAVGVAGAFGLTRLLDRLLFGIEPTDTMTFALVAGALATMSLAASYIPARRALSIDPVRALRIE